MILHGKPVQERVLADVKAGVEKLKSAHGVTPTLAVVLVGSDPASQIYVGHKKRGADAVAVVREAAKKIDGGGGGRPNLAEAGGKNPAGLAEAYEVGKRELASILS